MRAPHGLQVGWAQPTHDLKGVASLLTFARSGEQIGRAEFRAKAQQMHWLAQAAHAALENIVAARPDGVGAIWLTGREVEVLRWAADGKTAGVLKAAMLRLI